MADDEWNGEFYANYGCVEGARHDATRSWADAVEYGFFSGGGGRWYSDTLRHLNPGDRIWVNVPGSGYVGVGFVKDEVQPAARFKIRTTVGERPVFDVAKRGHYIGYAVDDTDLCEYFVPMKWLETVPVSQAFREPGLAGYRHTVCKPRGEIWNYTMSRLKQMFPLYDKI